MLNITPIEIRYSSSWNQASMVEFHVLFSRDSTKMDPSMMWSSLWYNNRWLWCPENSRKANSDEIDIPGFYKCMIKWYTLKPTWKLRMRTSLCLSLSKSVYTYIFIYDYMSIFIKGISNSKSFKSHLSLGGTPQNEGRTRENDILETRHTICSNHHCSAACLVFSG